MGINDNVKRVRSIATNIVKRHNPEIDAAAVTWCDVNLARAVGWLAISIKRLAAEVEALKIITDVPSTTSTRCSHCGRDW